MITRYDKPTTNCCTIFYSIWFSRILTIIFFKSYSKGFSITKQKSLKNIGFLLYSSDFWFCLATSYFRFDTIFGVQWLNFRVRDGNGCDPLAIVTILFIESEHRLAMFTQWGNVFLLVYMDLSKTNTSFDITVVTVFMFHSYWKKKQSCFSSISLS